MKYAFLNLVATTMFLMATGYLYGVFGTLNMADIWIKVNDGSPSGPINTIAVLYLSGICHEGGSFPDEFLACLPPITRQSFWSRLSLPDC